MLYHMMRKDHFAEWLSHVLAKESHVPKDIYDAILEELKKQPYDMSSLNTAYMKKILKKLELAKYYEHIPYIMRTLSGVQTPIINKETEERLKLMFEQIQIPFEKYC